jgi:hypothetical protein
LLVCLTKGNTILLNLGLSSTGTFINLGIVFQTIIYYNQNLSVMYLFRLMLIFTAACFIISCGEKKADTTANDPALKDTQSIKQTATDVSLNDSDTDTTLAAVLPATGKVLDKWMQSFKGLQVDSFHQVSKLKFEQDDYNDIKDISSFYELYKPSLSFSPDSSQFIDLYSYGITLEKKGKKIIAIADVDNSVTLCNLKTKEWKRIAFSGPSGNMEEAVWVSPVKFVIAGTMQNENSEWMPVLLIGNVSSKILRHFEASTKRLKTAKYEASGLAKLKIDEWE